jgi:hypothetical protein
MFQLIWRWKSQAAKEDYPNFEKTSIYLTFINYALENKTRDKESNRTSKKDWRSEVFILVVPIWNGSFCKITGDRLRSIWSGMVRVCVSVKDDSSMYTHTRVVPGRKKTRPIRSGQSNSLSRPVKTGKNRPVTDLVIFFDGVTDSSFYLK